MGIGLFFPSKERERPSDGERKKKPETETKVRRQGKREAPKMRRKTPKRKCITLRTVMGDVKHSE